MSKKNILSFLCIAILVSFCSIYRTGSEKVKTVSQPVVMFPTAKKPHNESMQALLSGKLVLNGRCLMVGENLLIWPYGFTMKANGSNIKIYGAKNIFIAQVGDSIELGGGQVNETPLLKTQLAGYTPGICSDTLWIIGDVFKRF
jgi:hypothetical protein